MAKVLIIDDEAQLRALLARIIALEGYEVCEAESITQGIKQIKTHQPDVVLLDVSLPDANGVEAIEELKSHLECGQIIMLTAHGNIADGVRSIKNGAYDYLTKGNDNDRIIVMIANAAEKVRLEKRLQKLEKIIDKEYTFDSIIGRSKPIVAAIDLAQKVAPTDASILLTGETGTGKEVFASAIHRASNRGKASFVAINCGALSGEILESEMFGHKAGAFTGAVKDKKGLFDQANLGTIFLDEVGEMPLKLQVKLLRVLESGEFIAVGDTTTKKVDVRVIAATNRQLKKMVERGEFREDLFYRLSVFSIELPPLRDRAEDIVLMASSFVEMFSTKMKRPTAQVEENFYATLKQYSWPGNIRELRNTIERCVILSACGELKIKDLPLDIQFTQITPQTNNIDWTELAAVEKSHIKKVLQHTSGNKTEAAKLMRIGLTTLYRKIEEYGIEMP